MCGVLPMIFLLPLSVPTTSLRHFDIFRLQVLQMELMFTKLASLETDSKSTNGSSNGAGDGNRNAGVKDKDKYDEEEEGLFMEPVAMQRFEASLSGGHWGIHAYVPVTFSGVHFIRVDCMVR